MHDKYACKTLDVIHNLRGFFVKCGQVASVRADMFPQQYVRELSSLQDHMPATDWSVIRTTMESELGDKICNVFKSIDEKPVGAASIGQVHKAVLKDGTPVVVKVMYPDVEDLFRVSVEFECTTQYSSPILTFLFG